MARIVEAVPEKPRVRVDILKGFKSQLSPYGPQFANIMADIHWHHTRIMGVNNPGIALDFLPPYREETKPFFCDPNDRDDIASIAGAHSLGVFLLLEMLLEEKSAVQFSKNYDAIYFANPFVGNDWHDKAFYRWFSEAVGGLQAVGNTLPELTLSRAFGATLPKDTPYELPTHRQSIMLHDYATALLERIVQNGGLHEAVRHMPIMVFSGNDDPVCKRDNVLQLVQAIGADHKEFNTGHNVILHCPESRDAYASWCNGIASAYEAANQVLGAEDKPEEHYAMAAE